MMALERRYRRLLGLLPRTYRHAWEDDMVATFLDRMTTGEPDLDEYLLEFGRPDAAETLSVISLAIRVRLAGPDEQPRAAMWGQAARTFALTCLLCLAVLLPLGLAQLAWASAGLWLPSAVDLSTAPDRAVWQEAMQWLTLIGWPAAFVAVLYARRLIALALSAAACLPTLGAALVSSVHLALGQQPWQGLATHWSMVLTQLLVIVSLVSFHEAASVADRAVWVRRLTVGALLAPAVGVLILLQPPTATLLNPVSLVGIGWLLVAAGHRHTLENTLTLALLAPVVVVLCGGWLVDAALPSGQSQLVGWTAAALTVICAVIAVPLWRKSRRQLNALDHAPV